MVPYTSCVWLKHPVRRVRAQPTIVAAQSEARDTMVVMMLVLMMMKTLMLMFSFSRIGLP